MPLRFRVLPTDDTRPAGKAGVAGPLVEREIALSDALAEIRVGRRADLELPLPFAVLSGVHARLSRPGAEPGWVVEDLGSTNGTWLDGAPLRPGERRPLAPGAELRLGGVRLRYDGPVAAAPDAAGTGTIARRLVDDLLGDAGEGAPSLRVVRDARSMSNSTSLRLAVLGRAYVVGRAETCALALPVEEISREHAAFVRRADGVVVRDLGSKNGVLVGGVRITAERALVDGDVVTVGPVTLSFDDPAARYLRELAQLPLDVAREIPPPPETVAPSPPPEPPVERTPAVRTPSSARLIAAVAAATLLLLAAAAVILFWPRR